MSFTLKLIKERNKKSFRAYLEKKKDIVEGNIPYLTNSNKAALWLAKTQKGWVKIDCVKNGLLENRENIHQEIYAKVKKVVK